MDFSIEDFTVSNVFEALVEGLRGTEPGATLELLGLPVDPVPLALQRAEHADADSWLLPRLDYNAVLGIARSLHLQPTDSLSVKMHTALTFLNGMQTALRDRFPDHALWVVSNNGYAWEQAVGLYKDRQFVRCTNDNALEVLIRTLNVRERSLGIQFKEWISRAWTPLQRMFVMGDQHVYASLLHYALKYSRKPRKATIYCGYDVTSTYNPYSIYRLDKQLAELLGVNRARSPFEYVHVVRRLRIGNKGSPPTRYESPRETCQTLLIAHILDSAGDYTVFNRLIDILAHNVELAPVDQPEEKSGVNILNQHIFPSRELLESIFIADSGSNCFPAGLVLLLSWSLTMRHKHTFGTYIKRLRGLMSVYHSGPDWLGSLTTKIWRVKMCSTSDTDAVALLDRIVICYVKLCLFNTLKKCSVEKLKPLRLIILRLLFLLPSISAKNLMLLQNKLECLEDPTDQLYLRYRTMINALAVNRFLGGIDYDVITCFKTDEAVADKWYDDMSLREIDPANAVGGCLLQIPGTQTPTPAPRLSAPRVSMNRCSFTDLVGLSRNAFPQVNPECVPFDEDLIRQHEFELEDSYNDLVECRDYERCIFRQTCRAVNGTEESQPAAGETECRSITLGAVQKTFGAQIPSEQQPVGRLGPLLLPEGADLPAANRLITSVLMRTATPPASFVHVDINDQHAIYSWRDYDILTILQTSEAGNQRQDVSSVISNKPTTGSDCIKVS